MASDHTYAAEPDSSAASFHHGGAGRIPRSWDAQCVPAVSTPGPIFTKRAA